MPFRRETSDCRRPIDNRERCWFDGRERKNGRAHEKNLYSSDGSGVSFVSGGVRRENRTNKVVLLVTAIRWRVGDGRDRLWMGFVLQPVP
jgi:hypothetical protein